MIELLKAGKSKAVIDENIRTEERKGKSHKQAVAIAMFKANYAKSKQK